MCTMFKSLSLRDPKFTTPAGRDPLSSSPLFPD